MTPREKFETKVTVVTAAQMAATAEAARSMTVDNTPFDVENPRFPWEPCVYLPPIDGAWLDQFQRYHAPQPTQHQEAA